MLHEYMKLVPQNIQVTFTDIFYNSEFNSGP